MGRHTIILVHHLVKLLIIEIYSAGVAFIAENNLERQYQYIQISFSACEEISLAESVMILIFAIKIHLLI